MILLDTSGLLAALDASQRQHESAAASLAAARPPLLLSPFALAELDDLIASRVGATARASLLAEVERNAYALEPMAAADVARAHKIIQRYACERARSASRTFSRSRPRMPLCDTSEN
jgi:predicted nucleic acid-binding protein